MTELDKSNFIFVLDRDDWSYKGILFAEADVAIMFKDSGMPPPPKEWVAGIMMMIWTDENGIWRSRIRFKYPSGNKMVASAEYGKDSNETKILSEIYSHVPMIYKKWYKNPDGSIEGMLKILEESDMIESKLVFKIDKQL